MVAVLLGLAVVAWLAYRPHRSAESQAGTGHAAAAPSAVAPAAAPRATQPAVSSAPAAGTASEIKDYAAALDEARGFRDAMLHTSEFGRILGLWMARDPEAALAYVRRLPAGADRVQAVLLVLPQIAARDPARALALARELVTNREESVVYSALFAPLAQADPAGASARLAEVPAGPGRENAVRAIADAWARRDPASAAAWVAQLSAADRAYAAESVATVLAEHDPLRAIELAQKHLTGPALARVLTTAVQALTESDLGSAAAIVRLLPAGQTQLLTAGDIARKMAARSPAEALAWAKTLSDGRVQQVAVNNALEAWAAEDPGAAARYVTQLPPGAAQTASAEYLARIYGARAPPDAAAWAETLPPAARDAADSALASAWARSNPAAAAQWASNLPDTPAKSEALQGALSYWVLADPAGARDFVGAMAGATQRDAAVAIAPQLAQSDPVATITWARSLPDPGAQAAALTAAYARWVENAPAAARAWLAASDLSPELKATLSSR